MRIQWRPKTERAFNITAAVTFAVLGSVELIFGWLLHNPALLARGTHDPLDGLLYLGGGVMVAAMRRMKRRNGPLILSLTIMVGLIALAVVSQRVADEPADISLTGSLTAGIIGLAGILVNGSLLYWRLRLGVNHHHGNGWQRLELWADVLASVIVVISAGYGYHLREVRAIEVAGWVTVAMMFGLLIWEIYELWKDAKARRNGQNGHSGHTHAH